MEGNRITAIVWSKSALNGLRKIYEYIAKNSPQNVAHIIDEIANKITALQDNPKRYKPDEYKRNNTGNYRAFEHKKIRITYKVTANRIDIIRIKHTRQKPQQY